MATNVDKEIEAIRVLLNALEPLDDTARESALDYVVKRLNIQHSKSQSKQPPTTPQISSTQSATTSPQAAVSQSSVHINDFKEEKQPRTAIEMAALVAYYLDNLAPEADRKSSVGTDDLDTYFKIAHFKLPAQQRYTLVNARNAGYFDSVGGGEYKLNAVGHNLVVHSMPRKGNESSVPRKRAAKKTKSRKSTKKKTK